MKNNIQLYLGDCIEVMKSLPDNSVDTIITDPPYGLSFMGKKWDYDVPSIEIWQECLRILKPGGTALIFAGSRTQHRMACNVEDAGFILKDCLMWLYGSGFPKATDISKQLDKGHKRKVVGKKSYTTPKADNSIQANSYGISGGSLKSGQKAERLQEDITIPTTPEAKLWNGWKSHGLKPAYEPIIVAMKPNEGTYAENALKHGVSGLNINEARIPLKKGENLSVERDGHKLDINKQGWGFKAVDRGNEGRFPANVILDEEAGKMLDEQTQNVKNTKPHKVKSNKAKYKGYGSITKKSGEIVNYNEPNAVGTSRFFYCAKASKKERNLGLDKFPVTNKNRDNAALTHVEGRLPSTHNSHPTVKPLSLMEYLCKLTKTPTGGIVLDPFMGSGTTGMACKLTGRKFIGIEKSEEYMKIASARIKAIERK